MNNSNKTLTVKVEFYGKSESYLLSKYSNYLFFRPTAFLITRRNLSPNFIPFAKEALLKHSI